MSDIITIHVRRRITWGDALIGELYYGDRWIATTLEPRRSLAEGKGPEGSRRPGAHIPAGQYTLALRTHGGFHSRYAVKFGESHHGMIQIEDVPGFTDVLLHIGNTAEDTRACLLVGLSMQLGNGVERITASSRAYRKVYDAIRPHLLQGQPVVIHYHDHT